MDHVAGPVRGAGATSAADLTLDTPRLALPQPVESFHRRSCRKLVALSRACARPASAETSPRN